MSSDGGVNPSVAQSVLLNSYLHIFAISILYYDHALTLGTEVSRIWRQPKTRSAYWFFLNRYLAFFGNIPVLVLNFHSLTPSSCKKYNWFRQLVLVANQVVVCVLLTLRIYALYRRDIRVLLIMLGSGIVLFGVACWSLIGQKSVPATQVNGCHIGLSRETGKHLATAWEMLFIYDLVIFVLTLFKTYRARQEDNTPRAVPILALVFRDGAMYFVTMAFCNLANILTFFLAGPFLRGSLSTFASSVSVTMMSRLMLNLHANADSGIHTQGSTTLGYSTHIMFTSRFTNALTDIAFEPNPLFFNPERSRGTTEGPGELGGFQMQIINARDMKDSDHELYQPI